MALMTTSMSGGHPTYSRHSNMESLGGESKAFSKSTNTAAAGREALLTSDCK